MHMVDVDVLQTNKGSVRICTFVFLPMILCHFNLWSSVGERILTRTPPSIHVSYQLVARDNVVDGVALLCCGGSCYRWTAIVSSFTW